MSRTPARVNAAFSLFMAFVLMLTCNIATFRPIAAYADDAVPQAGGGTVSLTKDYDAKDGYILNLRSAFELYRYPDGFSGEKVPVTVSTTDSNQFGPYTYDVSSSLKKMREGTLNETTGGGTLTVNGLPEGDYGFEETSSATGYAAYEGPRYFSVGNEASGWKTDYAPTNSSQDLGMSPIVNHKTNPLVMMDSPSGTDLDGTVLSVRKAKSDGTWSNDPMKSLFGGKPFVFQASSGSSFAFDLSGLGADTYYLVEDVAPTDDQLCKFEPVKFSVGLHGEVAVLSGAATLEGTAIRVRNDPAQATVLALDQHAAGVSGATLQLQKLDGATWDPVAGAEWTTADADDAWKGHTFTGLHRETTYRIVETKIPEGYVQADHRDVSGGDRQMVEFATDEYGAIKDVDLNNDGVPIDNLDWGSFRNSFDEVFIVRSERIVGQTQFTMHDATLEGGVAKPLAGARFDLYQKGTAPDGGDRLVNEDEHFTSDANGKVTTETTLIYNALTGEVMKHGLTPGTYYFKQVTAPADFVYDAAQPVTTDAFTVAKDGNRFTWRSDGTFGDFVDAADANMAANEPLDAAVRVRAVDADGGAGLAGATFELRRDDGTAIDTQTTAAAGTKFNKDDSNGNAHTREAAQDGELYFTNVPAGTYTVVQTAPASGYQSDFEPFTVQVGQNAPGVVYSVGDVRSTRILGSMTLAKKAEGAAVDDAGLNDAAFALEREGVGGTWESVGTFLTGKSYAAPDPALATPAADDGTLSIAGLGWGAYRLTETKAPAGYEPGATPAMFAFRVGPDNDGDVRLVWDAGLIENARTSVLVDAVDDATPAQRLADARFELSGTFADGSTQSHAWTSSTDAAQLFDGQLVVGEIYALAEIERMAGYLVSPGAITFKLTDAGTIELMGDPALADGSPAALLSADGRTLSVRHAKAHGELSFGKVERYAERCSDESLGAPSPDATRPLAGVEFTAFDDERCTVAARDADGNPAVAMSDADGTVAFENLDAKTYYVQETAASAGSVIDGTVYRAVFSPTDGTLSSFEALDAPGEAVTVVVNDRVRADIHLVKVSETDHAKTLPGGTYGLFKRGAATQAAIGADASEGLVPVARATTGTDGTLVFEGVLADEEYVICELSAPIGSWVSKNPVTVAFAEDDGVLGTSLLDDGSGTAFLDGDAIVWRDPQVAVCFAKQDAAGAFLAGAKLQVLDAAGAPVGAAWTSTGDAPHRMEGVFVAGEEYCLRELEAPDGYQAAADVTFTVEDAKVGPDEGYAQLVVMIDEAVTPQALPAPSKASPPPVVAPLQRTGDPLAGAALAAAGFALAGGCAVAVAARARRRRSDR